MASILKDKNIFVTGAGGFLGKHVCHLLQWYGAKAIHNKHDLIEHQPQIKNGSIDLVIHLAADIKGIGPNRAQPYRFLTNNIQMAVNIIDFAITHSLPIVAAGSVCAYPESAPIPFNEEHFWNGKVEQNNYGYGLSKRFLGGALESAAMQYGLRYVHLISANLYGPGDHFDDEGAHVIPSLISRIYQATLDNSPRVDVWGTGLNTRDFLYVDDAARAYVRAAEYLLEDGGNLDCNIGSGGETRIMDVAYSIAGLLGYRGMIHFDVDQPKGQWRRKLDTNKADELLEWYNITNFYTGLERTVKWFLEQKNS